MSETCPKPAGSFGFTRDRIAETVKRKGLLSMEIEFSLACNFKCPYCYNDADPMRDRLTAEQIDNIILQAKELGAEKIIVLGGEPMIYPSVHDRIRFMHRHGLTVEMFTNGSHMSSENARFMFEHDVAVVLKMNSRDKGIQNAMAGRDDAYEIIQAALNNLLEAGYPAPGKRLAASTVICEQNLNELPDMWRWLRNRGIEPYFEMITPQGSAAPKGTEACTVADKNLCSGAVLDISPDRHRELFETLARIDKEEFENIWEPQPPLVGNSCLRHCFSCLVNAKGEVMPCVGITIPIGNVLETPLKTILGKSEIMDNLRNYRDRIKGPCSSCEKAPECYGCRGAAYQLTGDYLASDPLCWHNRDKNIESLPADVEPLLPHRPPMLIVEKLQSVGECSGHLSALVKEDNPFIEQNGDLGETAYIEIMAQGLAAIEGFHKNDAERARQKGILTSVKNFSVTGNAKAGDRIDIHIQKVAKFGDFGAAAGEIRRGNETIASGELTFFQNGAKAVKEAVGSGKTD